MAPLGSQVLSIGALSQESRCNIETIRYYERIGVMPEPPRTEGGHRQCGEDHLKRLTFVRRERISVAGFPRRPSNSVATPAC